MTQPSAPQSGRSPVMVAIGWLMSILGGLWIALGGLCAGALFLAGATGRDFNIAVTGLVFAGFAIAPGVLLVWGGLSILREQRKLGGSPGSP